MQQILLIATKDIKSELKKFKKIILITIVSLISILFVANGLNFMFKEGLFINKVNIIVVNKDTHPLSNLLIHQVMEEQNIKSIMNLHIYEDINEAQNEVKNNSASAVIIIPKGFINSLEVGRNYPVQLVTNNANPILSQIIKSILDSYMKSVSAGQSAVNAVWDYYGKANKSYEEKSRKIDSVINDITLRAYLARSNVMEKEIVLNINSISSFDFYFFSVLILLIMFIAINGAKEVINERRNMIFQRLRLGGVTESKYILGKFIYLITKILIQSSVILVIATIILFKSITEGLVLLILLFILIVLSIISLGLLGSIVINSEGKYVNIGNSIVLIMAIIGGSIVPYIYLPSSITLFSKFTINYWAMNGFIGIFTNRQQEAFIAFIILALMTFTFVVTTIALFKYKEGWSRD